MIHHIQVYGILLIMWKMAGFVARSMQKCVTCSFCYQLLEGEVESKLQERKQYKKLISASPVLIKICKTAEKYFCSFSAATNIFNTKIKELNTVLVNNTMRHLQNFVSDSFRNHLYDHEFIDNHAIIFIKLALKIYFKIRVHYETKIQNEQNLKSRIRSTLTKTILFSNQ